MTIREYLKRRVQRVFLFAGCLGVGAGAGLSHYPLHVARQATKENPTVDNCPHCDVSLDEQMPAVRDDLGR